MPADRAPAAPARPRARSDRESAAARPRGTVPAATTSQPDAGAAAPGPVPLAGLALGPASRGEATGGVIRRSFMRGKPAQVRIAPGVAPPTTQALLLARWEAILEDEGLIRPAMLTDRAAALFRATNPRVVHADNPLAPDTLDDMIVNAVHHLADGSMKLADYIGGICGFVMTQAISEGRTLDLLDVQVRVDELFLPSVVQAELALYGSALTVRNAEIRAAVAGTVGHNPDHRDSLDIAAARTLAGAPRPKLAELDGPTKGRLITALETMPAVVRIYAGTIGSDADDGAEVRVNYAPGTTDQDHFMQYAQGFADRVVRALKTVHGLVEPARRPPAERVATVEINPDEVKRRFLRSPEITNFRADASRRNDRVRASVRDGVPTLVHEMGHQVEFALPIMVWLDLIQVLQDRAGRRLIDIYGNGEEIAFDAAMPAFREIYAGTGSRDAGPKYAAKIYASGDTELMSMSMEMLSQPAKARQLITHDPLLAATILRSIRPVEFAASVPADLRALLPRGDV